MNSPQLTFEQMMERLQSLADPAAVQGQARFGITAGAPLGISMPALRSSSPPMPKIKSEGSISLRALTTCEPWRSADASPATSSILFAFLFAVVCIKRSVYSG